MNRVKMMIQVYSILFCTTQILQCSTAPATIYKIMSQEETNKRSNNQAEQHATIERKNNEQWVSDRNMATIPQTKKKL